MTLALPDDHWLTGLTAWMGGFAALESDDDDDLFALWNSPDGAAWERAPLPDGVHNGRLVALQDHLYLLESRGRGDSHQLRIRTWRTSDHRHWENQGLFEWHLPASVGDDWRIISRFVVAAPDRLVMFGEVWPCCGTGGSLPLGSKYASIVTATEREHVPLGGLIIWTSRDGAEWSRQSNKDLRDPASGDNAWLLDVEGVGGGILASSATGDALFTSPDGSTWESIGPLPPGYPGLDSLGLVRTGDRVIVSFRVRAATGGRSLGIWLRQPDGSWRRSLQEAHMYLNDLVATGPVVVASAQSVDTGTESLPIALVSSDGGLTWAADPSFPRSPGWCARDLTTDGSRLVMLGCEEGAPTLWYAEVPSIGMPG